ncbi:MAG: DNA mismatch repair protein MutS, partial [Eubacterium sp.]|nr:DNA mismatch repair protein MutS [Eubacterium sp.]
MGKMSPMMTEYLKTKEEYKDCILFYRLGDFYEMFFEDALTSSKELELTLTGKNCGMEERAPMCGVPFHSAESYINKLIDKGYKVAICEQVEDPKEAKGLVKREVTRIVTPGTNSFTATLDESKNNYIMSVVCSNNMFGLAMSDITTGEFHVFEVEKSSELLDEINRYMPAEIISNDALYLADIDLKSLSDRLNIVISALEPAYFDPEKCKKSLLSHFKVKKISDLNLDNLAIGTVAAGCLIRYLNDTQMTDLRHISNITIDNNSHTMLLDRNTRRNLELVETIRDKEKRGTLLWVLDKTKTAMGARMLRYNVERPLLDKDRILLRYDAVEDLLKNPVSREELREYLKPIYDLERLISKVSYKTINPRDMLSLGNSLAILPAIKQLSDDFDSKLLKELFDELDPLDDITNNILDCISDEPPMSLRDGDIIKTGFNPEVDKLRLAKTQGKDWLAELEGKERENTGIKNLRIKYNKVFGYYLEVTKSNIDLVPKDWIRKQTLVNAERYSTEELNELEETILGAQDRLYNLEYALFCELREDIFSHMQRIQKSASVIAKLDMLASFAYVAESEGYVRPILKNDGSLSIRDGRHPVIEKMIENDLFIPNDTYLDNKNDRIAIITGPNMAGKSTYMRQVALIQLMAQIGSFVPAKEASLSIVDRIFTRVGASDDLASG